MGRGRASPPRGSSDRGCFAGLLSGGRPTRQRRPPLAGTLPPCRRRRGLAMNSGDTFPCASWRGETRVAGGPQGRRSAHPEPSLRSRPTRHARPATALDGLLRGAPACQVLAFQLHQVQQKNPACSRVTGHSVTTRVPTALVPSLLAGAARAVPPSKECCGPRVARRPRVRASHARVGNAAGLAHSTNWHGAVPSSALRISPPVAPAPAQREGTEDECCRCMRPPAPRPVAGSACRRHPPPPAARCEEPHHVPTLAARSPGANASTASGAAGYWTLASFLRSEHPPASPSPRAPTMSGCTDGAQRWGAVRTQGALEARNGQRPPAARTGTHRGTRPSTPPSASSVPTRTHSQVAPALAAACMRAEAAPATIS